MNEQMKQSFKKLHFTEDKTETYAVHVCESICSETLCTPRLVKPKYINSTNCTPNDLEFIKQRLS